MGCGSSPRNPYNQDELFGVDLSMPTPIGNLNFRPANLCLEGVPFDSNTFDSVSAFDFLEHIPRQIHLSANSMPRLPFVELMNEVWRVLKPGGKFYAMTPGYPNPAAFVDPTHVNFITEDTHMYFCGVKPIGKIYGFYGKFEVLRCERVIPKDSFEPDVSISKVMRKWHRKLMKPSGLSHIVWELKAEK